MASYLLAFEDRTTYLYVRLSGELTEKTDHDIDVSIKQECETLERNKVLIDIRDSDSRLSYQQNFAAARTYRQRMGTYIIAIAIVDSSTFQENSELFELTAVNRGARVKFFTSTAEAENWLELHSVSTD